MKTSLTFVAVKPMSSAESVRNDFVCNRVLLYIGTATFWALNYVHDIFAFALIFEGDVFVIRSVNLIAKSASYRFAIFEDYIIIIKFLKFFKVNISNSTGVTITT